MNRVKHLKETLPINILDNLSYGNVEFLILDYNSTDGLKEWILEGLKEYLEIEVVKYFRITEPESFHRSHSRNLSFKLATGDIICNVDADNFIGNGFAEYICKQFNLQSNIFLTAIDFHKIHDNYSPPSDTFGRICCTKKDFLRIKGYDEKMSANGFEDYDFANRLELSGLSRTFITDMNFLKAITHSDTERFENETIYKVLHQIIFRPLRPYSCDLIFLYNTVLFERGVIIENLLKDAEFPKNAYRNKLYKYQFTLKKKKWQQGKWRNYKKGIIELSNIRNELRLLFITENISSEIKKNEQYFVLQDEYIINDLIVFNSQFTNRNIMQNNWDKKRVIVNIGGFGRALVTKNGFFHKIIEIK